MAPNGKKQDDKKKKKSLINDSSCLIDIESQGIIPRIVSSLFSRISSDTTETKYTVIVSMIEIYNETIKDLLDPENYDLKIFKTKKKNGVKVNGVAQYICQDDQEVFQLVDYGNKNKAVENNMLNERSSRSHSIMTI